MALVPASKFSITINGVEIPTPFPVYYSEKLTFPYALPRKIDPDLIVLHDTAGEGDGVQIHKTLLARKLSIHFAISRDGSIFQYVDPGRFICAHVGKGYNSRSIGIEMANLVFPVDVKPGLFANVKRYVLTGKEKLTGRPVVIDEYRGAKRRVLGHFSAQRLAATDLVRILLRVFPSIQRKISINGDRLPADFSGVAPHLGLTDRHVDPAMDVLKDLTAVVLAT